MGQDSSIYGCAFNVVNVTLGWFALGLAAGDAGDGIDPHCATGRRDR